MTDQDTTLVFARQGLCAILCLVITAATGCGSDGPEASGSGGAMTAPADPREVGVTDGTSNRAPVVVSVRLSPREPAPGERLEATAIAKDPDGDPIELVYSWKVKGREVEGTGPEIILDDTLARRDEITVSVVASDGRGTSDPKAMTARVGNRPPRILDLAIRTRGTADGEGGEWVVEPEAEDPDGDLVEFDYVWRLGRRTIGEEQTLTRSGWTRGDEITVTVVARDRDDASAPVESAPLVIGNSAPDIVSRPPGLDPSGSFRYQVEAKDADGDRGLRYSLGEAPDGMEVDPFGGLVTWNASIDDEGEHKVEIIVDDRKGATTKQVFFLAVRAKSSASPASIR